MTFLDNNTPQKTLYAPDIKKHKLASEALDTNYSPTQLKRICASVQPIIQRCSISLTKNLFLRQYWDAYKKKEHNSNKNILCNWLALIISDQRNFEIYFESLPEAVQNIWRHLFLNQTISLQTSKKLLKYDFINATPEPRWHSYDYYESNHCSWFNLVRGKMASESYFSEYKLVLPSYLDTLLISFFNPEIGEQVLVYDHLPEERKLNVYEGENMIFRELSLIYGLKNQGYLTVNEKGKVSVTTLKKIVQKLRLKEFFPLGCKETDNLRCQMLIQSFALFWPEEEDKQLQPSLGIKLIFGNHLYDYGVQIIPLLLPNMKGFRTSELLYNSFRKVFIALINQFMAYSANGWMDVNSMLLHSRLQALDLSPLGVNQIETMNLRYKDQIVTIERRRDLFTYPLIKSFFFMLAAFGIIDIAYEDYNEKSDGLEVMPFDTLKYIRLTKLGRYAFGMDMTYTMPKIDQTETLFVLDENNLIIRSLKEDNPYESLLADMSTAIGNHRYKLSHLSLLNSCSTPQDLKNKIDFFKQFITSDLPPLWSNFFNSLKQHCQPLKEVPQNKYAVYQLEVGNRELMQLISSDPIIRQYSIKAEGYLLLIESAYLKKVTERLKVFGYLL